MPENEDARLKAIIEGYVQGVGFRAFVLRKARDLGISGWVRNRRDGSVEVVAEGDRPALDNLLVALRRGPLSARVTDLKCQWQAATGEFQDFDVKYTL